MTWYDQFSASFASFLGGVADPRILAVLDGIVFGNTTWCNTNVTKYLKGGK